MDPLLLVKEETIADMEADGEPEYSSEVIKKEDQIQMDFKEEEFGIYEDSEGSQGPFEDINGVSNVHMTLLFGFN